MKLKATYFDRVDNPQGEAIELDGLADIEELVTSKKAATKTELPLLKLATFKDNYRRNYNVDAISGIEVDYDAGQIAPWSAAEQLDQAGLNCLIVSTPSHNPTSGQNRWRGFFPTSTELAPSEHRKLVSRVNGLFGGRLAPESFTLSQAYFIGSVENAEFPVESYLFLDLPLLTELTTENCARFNAEPPDRSDVRYLSWAAARPVREMPFWARPFARRLMGASGENDGQVSVSSARWGMFQEVLRADHWEVAGWRLALLRGGVAPFEHRRFLDAIISGNLGLNGSARGARRPTG